MSAGVDERERERGPEIPGTDARDTFEGGQSCGMKLGDSLSLSLLCMRSISVCLSVTKNRVGIERGEREREKGDTLSFQLADFSGDGARF